MTSAARPTTVARAQAGRVARKVRRELRRKLASRRAGVYAPGTDWARLLDSGLFDPTWYLQAYPDVGVSGLEPLAHFALVGAGQGRNPNADFDTAWYRTTYAGSMGDVAHPVFDYLDGGFADGRDPGPTFDTSWYLAAYPDIAEAGVNPLAHYIVCGLDEGRRPVSPGVVSSVGARVVLVSGEPHTPGHQYRVVRLAEAIDRLGGRTTVLDVDEAAGARVGELTDSDAVILWRTTWSAEIRTIFRRAWQSGAAVIFDVDDLMVDPDMATLDTIDGIRTQGLTEDAVRGMYSLVRRCAETADACICTTEELATPLRRMGKITHVVPNGFDDETYVRSRLAVRRQASGVSDGLCRIGYASGSRTHQRDFATMAEPVAEVMRAHAHTRLVLFRNAFDLDEFPMFDDLRDQIEWRDIVPLADLPAELARLDVNLAPLEVGNPFCEAKSDLKYFEAALVDVPTVASPTGPFRRAIDHGVTGFLADSADECRSALEKLVVDADLRRATGRAAHDAVAFSHGTERRAQRIKAVLDQVLDHGANAADAFAVEVTRREPPRPTPPALAPVRTVFERDRLRGSWVTVVVPVYNYAGRSSRPSTRSRRRRSTTSTSSWSRTTRPTIRWPWSPCWPRRTPSGSTASSCCRTSTTPASPAPATVGSRRPRRPTSFRSTPTTSSCPTAPPACSRPSRRRAPRSATPTSASSGPRSIPNKSWPWGTPSTPRAVCSP